MRTDRGRTDLEEKSSDDNQTKRGCKQACLRASKCRLLFRQNCRGNFRGAAERPVTVLAEKEYEREVYKGTPSEETTIEKEHKTEEIRRISTSEKLKW